MNELIEFGELQPQPVLGVTINRIPQTLPDGAVGLRLEAITDGLSGDRAGLRAGDYLVAFAGQDVVSYQQLLNIRRDLRVGDEVAVRVYREGEYLEMTMIMMAESRPTGFAGMGASAVFAGAGGMQHPGGGIPLEAVGL